MSEPTNLSHPESHAKLVRAEPDEAEIAWTLLADHVGLFCEAWDNADTPPPLGDYAPLEPPALRRLALIELVKIDLEQRWPRGVEPLRIEDYLAQHPELTEANGNVPIDLIYEEYHVRRQCGDDVAADEFVRRFPTQLESLERLFGFDTFPGEEALLVGDDGLSAGTSRSTSLFSSDEPNIAELGDSIDEFDLIVKLGKGSFGSVYLARQRSMQRLVALKITATRSNEAQTLAQLDHPHIVRVYDERDVPEKRVCLLYMQYVAGTSLDQIIKAMRGRPASEWSGAALVQTLNEQMESRGESASAERFLRQAGWTDVVCRLGIQLASALEYAHSHSVLHRDLKPANVLLDASGSAKIVDFNISYCSKLDGATPAAYFGGSLAYMSPEQMLACDPGHPQDPSSLDARSDVYSLGVVLWELLVGSRPFHDKVVADGWPATLAAAIAKREHLPEPTPLEQLPFPNAKALSEVLLRCLQPNPEDRPASAADVARQLRLCAEPETRRLLNPRRGFWQQMLERAPLLILLLLVLLPNVVAAAFNFEYNDQEIIDKFPDAKDEFMRTQLAINGIAFPLGLALCALVAWPVANAFRKAATDNANADRWRRRCLMLGHWGAMLGVVEWLVAGVAYPVSINMAGIALTPRDYFHFMTSLALCGTIAATYPFFLITSAAIQHVYPRLVSQSPASLDDVELLRRVERRTWRYLALAAVLPLAGVGLLVVLGPEEKRQALGVLSLGGLVGFVWIFWLASSLQRTIARLIGYIEISNEPLETLADTLK